MHCWVHYNAPKFLPTLRAPRFKTARRRSYSPPKQISTRVSSLFLSRFFRRLSGGSSNLFGEKTNPPKKPKRAPDGRGEPKIVGSVTVRLNPYPKNALLKSKRHIAVLLRTQNKFPPSLFPRRFCGFLIYFGSRKNLPENPTGAAQ